MQLNKTSIRCTTVWNELGVAEPVIQQSGLDRIVVQLPGVQDTAKAKDIIGRTATLEVRMVEDDPIKLQEALNGNVPTGYELLSSGGDHPETILVNKQVELTGDNINDAQPSFDQMGAPAVSRAWIVRAAAFLAN